MSQDVVATKHREYLGHQSYCEDSKATIAIVITLLRAAHKLEV